MTLASPDASTTSTRKSVFALVRVPARVEVEPTARRHLGASIASVVSSTDPNAAAGGTLSDSPTNRSFRM
jgi:hypothetical protein